MTTFLIFAVSGPQRYYRYSPAWFMHWPWSAVLALAWISLMAWLLMRLAQGRLSSRQLLFMLLLIALLASHTILNVLLTAA